MSIKKSMLAVALVAGLGAVGSAHAASHGPKARQSHKPGHMDFRPRLKGTPPNPLRQTKAQKKAERRQLQRERAAAARDGARLEGCNHG